MAVTCAKEPFTSRYTRWYIINYNIFVCVCVIKLYAYVYHGPTAVTGGGGGPEKVPIDTSVIIYKL